MRRERDITSDGGGAGDLGSKDLCIVVSLSLISLILYRVYLLWEAGEAGGRRLSGPPAGNVTVAGRGPQAPWPAACECQKIGGK